VYVQEYGIKTTCTNKTLRAITSYAAREFSKQFLVSMFHFSFFVERSPGQPVYGGYRFNVGLWLPALTVLLALTLLFLVS